jgi:hypothetical protein
MILRGFMGLSDEQIDSLTDWEAETYPLRWIETIGDVLSVLAGRILGNLERIEPPKEEREDKEVDKETTAEKRRDYEAGFMNVMGILKKAGN